MSHEGRLTWGLRSIFDTCTIAVCVGKRVASKNASSKPAASSVIITLHPMTCWLKRHNFACSIKHLLVMNNE